jgi:cytochrome P450
MLPSAISQLPTPANIRYNRARQRLRDTIAQIIAEYRAGGIDRGGLLPLLMASRDLESAQQQLSDEECADQAVTIFFAGIETAAITLAWALHSVAQDAGIRTRLYAEADEVLSGRTATFADMPRLEYTGRIITETLRMRSPTWLITRVVTTDTQLGPYHLPAGKIVGCSPLMTHLNPGLHHDPDTFNPDRWQDASSHTVTMIPFSGGARKCIGDGLSAVETTLGLASIAARWHIESVVPAKASLHAFHVPKNLEIKFTAREPQHSLSPAGSAT